MEWRALRRTSRTVLRWGGNKVSAEESFLPVDLVRKGDEVANLVDSSLEGKRVEPPPLLRGNAEPSVKPRSRGFGVGFPAPRTDRHRVAGG